MTHKKTYAVVYQMGKVASTSIVATLNEFPDIEAVQSHFLGERALSSVIPSITGAEVPQYFFKHQLGQFLENVRITRRVNKIRAGHFKNERLLVISLARNPVEWARSSIVQDAKGYLPIFRALCNQNNLDGREDEAAVRNGLECVLKASCDLLRGEGGLDTCNGSGPLSQKRLAGTIFENNPGATRVLLLLMRPADWFEKHFNVAFGAHPSEMTKADGVWTAEQSNTSLVISRYEDMSASLPRWLEKQKICEISSFKKENTSGKKLFSDVIAEGFKSDFGRELGEIYAETRYCQIFGYI